VLSIFRDLGMKQIVLAQSYNKKYVYTNLKSHVDFFASNWVTLAGSGQKILPRTDNNSQERFF
jgi:hypothetical protein